MAKLPLLDALDLGHARCVALVGSGGKTSLLFRLARAYQRPVLVSNTAHLGVDQGRYADRVIVVQSPEDIPLTAGNIPEGVTLFTGPADARGRTSGLAGETLSRLRALADLWGAPLLIEADGSRGLPLKAPADWEPVIPGFAGAVIVVVGLSALGQPLNADWVYRPDDFARLAQVASGAPVEPDGLAGVLLHPRGGLKGIPPSAMKIVFFNQRDACPLADGDLDRLAIRVLAGFQRAVVGALHGAQGDPVPEIEVVHQPLAAVVLAAGAASRMGAPKQLLEWEGEALVRRAARLAIEAGFEPVVVVAGAYAQEVIGAVEGLKLRVAMNERWEEGQSGSVKAGLAAFDRPVGGAIFLLADQPYLNVDLLRSIRLKHAQTLGAVVAPRVAGKRANPILFDRRTFADLADLQGDAGGRQVLAKWTVEWVDWPDERLLLDIDDPEGYEHAKRAAG